MNALVDLLDRLAAWLDAWLQRLRKRRRQDQRDALESDPADWYRQHFGGVRDDAPDNVADANPAESDDSEQSR